MLTRSYNQAPMIEECLTIVLAATLETRDLLMGLQEKKASEVWEVKDSLKVRSWTSFAA